MLNNFFREGGSEVNPAQNIITSHTLLKSLIIELSQEFCHKILFQSGTFLDLKNTVSLQAANIANFTDNIVFSCSVKKEKSFQAARLLVQRCVWITGCSGRVQNPSVYVHMCNRNENCGNFYSGLTHTEMP